MAILIVGGAGYIGSHMSHRLLHEGQDVVVLDNFSAGRREAVQDIEVVEGDMEDPTLLDSLFSSRDFSAVMHFAACIEVGESVINPSKYYRNNVHATQQLLDRMVAHKVPSFIFSSTAAIFGSPEYTPIDEEHPKKPINPYGRSKLMVEQILEDYDHAYGLKSICLRYFNAAGADPLGRIGECHDPETHLIPLVLQAASGRRESITVFGDDYETPDGTCVRDYIHVADLCAAHLLALESLARTGRSGRFNLGNGRGFSVREVIEAAQRVTSKPIPVTQGDARPGDPAILVADSARAAELLGWQPRYDNLDEIIQHAWAWERKHFLGEG